MIDEKLSNLRNISGCSLNDCKKAIKYAGDNNELAIAYLKAISLAIATPKLTLNERVQYFYNLENKE